MANNFQRVGARSNSHVGRDFEEAAPLYFMETGVELEANFSVTIGFPAKKSHRFDLGSETPPILVGCKTYTWTETRGVTERQALRSE